MVNANAKPLHKVFGLKLNPGELGAMMQEFDKDGDGTVNCAEFLLTFFRVGFESRNRALQRYSYSQERASVDPCPCRRVEVAWLASLCSP